MKQPANNNISIFLIGLAPSQSMKQLPQGKLSRLAITSVVLPLFLPVFDIVYEQFPIFCFISEWLSMHSTGFPQVDLGCESDSIIYIMVRLLTGPLAIGMGMLAAHLADKGPRQLRNATLARIGIAAGIMVLFYDPFWWWLFF